MTKVQKQKWFSISGYCKWLYKIVNRYKINPKLTSSKINSYFNTVVKLFCFYNHSKYMHVSMVIYIGWHYYTTVSGVFGCIYTIESYAFYCNCVYLC